MHHEPKWVATGRGTLVWMGVCAWLLVAQAQGGSVTLAWNASPGTNLLYRLYVGGASQGYTNHIEAGTNLTATVSNLLSSATYYFAATCYDQDGTESAFSNEVAYHTPPAPPVLRQDQVLVEVPVTFWSTTNLGGPGWQVLGGSSAWLVVPATNPSSFFSATPASDPTHALGVTITRSTNQ